MCTFMSSLPKHSKSNGGNKSRNLLLNMKPCADEKTFYRFRLLAFSGVGTDRDDPFIERFVHQRWGRHPEKGYPVLEDEITCPVTPHVHVEGNRYDACKICGIANKYFITFKESNWKDKEACRKNKEFGRRYQAIIPVYVVNDPNYEGNNNKFRVIIFNDKKQYQEFRSKVEKASMRQNIFNGKQAVDCCIHVSEVPEVRNEGKANEYVYKAKVIDKIIFSVKPYDIPSITTETVNAMGFDQEYYTTSTPDEINAFYKKYCMISNDDIPDEDEVPVFQAPKAQAIVKPTSVQNDDITPDNEIESLPDVNSLLGDPDEEGLGVSQSVAPEKTTASGSESDMISSDASEAKDLLKELGL